MVAVRNNIRIAMDDMLTLFDNAPRSGCLAAEQVKEAYWVVFDIPVQSYVRGRPSKAMPCFSDEAFDGVAVGFSTGCGAGGLRP